MATNPVFPSSRLRLIDGAIVRTNPVSFLLALLLALTLGLSAVDIQREKVLQHEMVSAGQTAIVTMENHALLDGRGKWGGY